MQIKDIEKLAELARIHINDEEKKELLGEFQAILNYIDQIEQAPILEGAEELMVKNIFREDNPPVGGPHQTGIYTEKLLAEAPQSREGYFKVQKIL